jgi:hypothetical protein
MSTAAPAPSPLHYIPQDPLQMIKKIVLTFSRLATLLEVVKVILMRWNVAPASYSPAAFLGGIAMVF